MPELPEVETVTRGIQNLVGRTITNVITRHLTLRYPLDQDLKQKLSDRTIISITRRAKYILLELDNQAYIIIHLGMSGTVALTKASQELKKHDHVDIVFDWDVLRYNDPRRFGCVIYTPDPFKHVLLRELGPEPLTNSFNSKYLYNKLHNKKSTIKQLIMDNHIVVGVGNIYACEALFLSHISPTRLGNTLSEKEVAELVTQIKKVLKLAIELGGSSLRDYKKADGNLGYFQSIHNVYAKADEKCTKCNTIIKEIRLGQRNSFYCPSCQK